jgi:hypothetical protein
LTIFLVTRLRQLLLKVDGGLLRREFRVLLGLEVAGVGLAEDVV